MNADTKNIRVRATTHNTMRKIVAHNGDKSITEMIDRLMAQEWARVSDGISAKVNSEVAQIQEMRAAKNRRNSFSQ